MRSRLNNGVFAGVAAVLLWASSGAADFIVAIDDWNYAGIRDWNAAGQSWVSLANPGSGGITNSGYLQVTMAGTTITNLDEWAAEVTSPSQNLFAGTWDTNSWVEFDFWAEYQEPNYVQVLWGSTNSHVWADTVFDSSTDTLSAQTWTALSSAQFTSYLNWGGWYSQQEFLDDLAAIDWLGVVIYRGAAGEQIYGLDDFKLMIPEPSEVLMLGVALSLVVATVWHERRKGRSAAKSRDGSA